MLLVASYVFYAWWNWRLIFLILFTTLVSYGAALYFQYREKGKKAIFVLSLVLILGTLLFFKYYNFFARGVGFMANAISGNTFDFTLDILLPVGISFYTFQTLSYVVDVYKGKVQAEKNIFIYALFVSFFPQLVAGPIERPEHLIPQLKQEHVFNQEDVTQGFRQMVIGFFEKIAVADLIGVFVNKVYENIGESNGFLVLLSTILFSIQILCDFKGYSDIAKGVARIYGIRLSDNFDRPYGARSVREFWRKWHMTLSYWFRDYLYIPLGGSRVPYWRYCLNILIVFAVSGLWHGADITFLLWGVMHAVFQIAESVVDKIHKPKETRLLNGLRVGLTFTLVTFAWILFRSNSMADFNIAVTKLFTDWSLSADFFLHSLKFIGLSWHLAVVMLSVFAVYFSYGALLRFLDATQNITLKRVCKVALFSLMMIMTIGTFIYLKSEDISSSFIYFQF